jgi:hypothetical protein
MGRYFGVDSLLVFIPGYLATPLKTSPQKFSAQARTSFYSVTPELLQLLRNPPNRNFLLEPSHALAHWVLPLPPSPCFE